MHSQFSRDIFAKTNQNTFKSEEFPHSTPSIDQQSRVEKNLQLFSIHQGVPEHYAVVVQSK